MASEAGDACPSHAQHTRRRGILPRVARTRKRFWAKTLTLTAALLAVVWVGSMKMSLWVDVSPKLEFCALNGALFVVWDQPDRPFENWGVYLDTSTPWGPIVWKFRKFRHFPGVTWTIPLWPFVLLTGVPGVWMLVKTRKRTNTNACPACGYDRTGLPQSSTGPAPCPECGKGAGSL